MGPSLGGDELNKERILHDLKAHPNEHITTAEVAARTRLTRDQVTSALHAMRRTMKPFVRRVGDAVWVYAPNPRGIDIAEPDRKLYEAVGNRENGATVVRGPDGALYELTALS